MRKIFFAFAAILFLMPFVYSGMEGVELRTSFVKAFIVEGGDAVNRIISLFNSGEEREFIVEKKDNYGFFDVVEESVAIIENDFGFVNVRLDGREKNLAPGIYVGNIKIFSFINNFAINFIN